MYGVGWNEGLVREHIARLHAEAEERRLARLVPRAAPRKLGLSVARRRGTKPVRRTVRAWLRALKYTW